MALGLEDLGLIERGLVPVPRDEEAEETWQWLSKNAGGDKLVFLADGFYSAGWDNSKLAEIGQEILARIKAGEIDLVLAMGTPSSQIMATDAHSTPVLSITTTDPVAAGISKTPESSGLEHVHVQVEAGKIERQLSMFHKAIGFNTLGVPYDTSPEGQATMGLTTIEKVAAQKGFVIVPCHAELNLPDREASYQNLMACLNRLALESEAVYLTVSNGMIEERMEEILAPLVANNRPTFSQKGPTETRMGVLMSLAEDDFLSSGRFEAEVIRGVLSGRRPGAIDQIHLPPLTIAINFDILGLIDPNITVNIIENEKITEKIKLKLPERVENVLICKNPRCITSTEKYIPHVFHLENREARTYRCEYCDDIKSAGDFS
ncbi:MAG: aspartate carbamoyltransferase regulatory subunit [Deltaproteobacteria bacterium]|nr:aspartate carbamoyltransferase regulatory subunit [Deltaproteobacteria bacterium]